MTTVKPLSGLLALFPDSFHFVDKNGKVFLSLPAKLSHRFNRDLIGIQTLTWYGRRSTIGAQTLSNLMFVKNQSKDSEGEVEFPDYLFPSPIPVPVAVAVGPQGAPAAALPALVPGTPVKVDPKEEV